MLQLHWRSKLSLVTWLLTVVLTDTLTLSWMSDDVIISSSSSSSLTVIMCVVTLATRTTCLPSVSTASQRSCLISSSLLLSICVCTADLCSGCPSHVNSQSLTYLLTSSLSVYCNVTTQHCTHQQRRQRGWGEGRGLGRGLCPFQKNCAFFASKPHVCDALWHPFEVILLLVENEQQCTKCAAVR